MKYIATLSEDQPLDFRSNSLGRFIKGEGREVDLTPEEARSFKGKGFELEPVLEQQPIEDEAEAETPPQDKPKKATRSSRGKE